MGFVMERTVAQSNFRTHFLQVSREIKLELSLFASTNRLTRRVGRRSQPDLLPEQRMDNEEAIRRRNGEAFLRAVQCGAIHR